MQNEIHQCSDKSRINTRPYIFCNNKDLLSSWAVYCNEFMENDHFLLMILTFKPSSCLWASTGQVFVTLNSIYIYSWHMVS